MKEGILSVLLYLFEHYFVADNEFAKDPHDLRNSLNKAGFNDIEIHRALAWLSVLNSENHFLSDNVPVTSVRIFDYREMDRLDTECRGFLLSLEQDDIINATHREIILDRVFALEKEQVDIEDLKWVVLIVLFNQQNEDGAAVRYWIKSRLKEEYEEDGDDEETELTH